MQLGRPTRWKGLHEQEFKAVNRTFKLSRCSSKLSEFHCLFSESYLASRSALDFTGRGRSLSSCSLSSCHSLLVDFWYCRIFILSALLCPISLSAVYRVRQLKLKCFHFIHLIGLEDHSILIKYTSKMYDFPGDLRVWRACAAVSEKEANYLRHHLDSLVLIAAV